MSHPAVKRSERSGWGQGARGAQAARRAGREPRPEEWEEDSDG